MGGLFSREFIFFQNFAPVGAFTNCTGHPFFRVTVRGIGYSFQLAITTPRINLIGYGTATAQSYCVKALDFVST